MHNYSLLHKTSTGIISFFILFFFINVQISAAKEQPVDKPYKLNLSLETGYRMDTLVWSIEGYSGRSSRVVNVLSELEYNDIISYQAGLKLTLDVRKAYLRTSYTYGTILDGTCMDSDYERDDRRGLWSQSESSVEDDDVSDFSLAGGYRFTFLSSQRLTLIPLIGFSMRKQNFRMTEGVQIEPDTGAFSEELDSTYRAEWRTGFIGADAKYNFTKSWAVFSTFEFHYGEYKAEADWNLRDDFQHPVSFSHDADAIGLNYNAGMEYIIKDHWNITLQYNYSTWFTRKGTDTVYFSSGETVATTLNEVTWESQSIMFTLGYYF